MPMTETLREIAETADVAPEDAIQAVLDSINDDDDRTRFLQGLTARLYAANDDANDDTVGELMRWVGSWLISLQLVHDPHFIAADDEASKLIAAGKLGDGITPADLRARYRR